MNIVWFKRDLRIFDNESITNACKNRKIMPLYIIEPELWQQDDLSYRQYTFLKESLQDLDSQLRKIGQKLIIRKGDALEIFKNIHNEFKIKEIWSHQETWNNWTFERDLKLKKWFHREIKISCDRHNKSYYKKYKKKCDEYFYLPHRKESRGIGGIFLIIKKKIGKKIFTL